MTKKEFKEAERENEYISNLLHSHRKNITEKLDVFFESLSAVVCPHGFTICVHTHYSPIKVSVYNGMKKDSHRLEIQGFKIMNVSDGFPVDVMKIVEDWLEGLDDGRS